VIEVLSGTPGPCAAICAALHGDEVVGTGVVHRLAQQLPRALRRGSVLLFPALNPPGLRLGARRLPGEERDLNRLLPGDARGDGGERAASCIWHELLSRRPEAVLDLHADSPACIPYAILDRVLARQGRPARRRLKAMRALAAATGLTVISDYPEAPYRHLGLDRSLAGALVNQGNIPAITLELGPRRMVDPVAVDSGVVATLGVLTQLGMAARPATAHPSLVGGGPWRRDSGPRSTREGLLVPLCTPGTVLVEGSTIAEVRDIDGTALECIEVPRTSVVLSLVEQSWCQAGSHVATVAVPDED